MFRVESKSINFIFLFAILSFVTFFVPVTASDTGLIIGDYVSFADPASIEPRYIKYGPKQWKAEERSETLVVMARLLREHGGLFNLATRSHKINLFRVNSIKNQESVNRQPFRVVIQTADTNMFLTDRFFESDRKSLQLLHELVHAADSGGLVAYSKEWVVFIANTSNRAKELAEKLNTSESNLEYICNQLLICPNLFCLKSQEESLAYFFTEISSGKQFKLPPVVLSKLTNPSAVDLEWRMHFSNGLDKLDRFHDPASALSEFLKVEELEPTSPLSAVNIGRCYAKLEQPQKSANAYRKAIDRFTSIGCSLNDPELVLAKYRLSLELIKLGELKEAQLLLLEFLPNASNEGLRDYALIQLEKCKNN